MTSRDDPQQKTVQKIKRLRELRRLLLNLRLQLSSEGHTPQDHRLPPDDLVAQIEVQIAWLEHRLSTGPDTGEYGHA